MPIFWGTGEVDSRASLQAEEREVHAVFLPQYNNVGCRLLWWHDPSSIIPWIPISPFKPALINVSSWLTFLLSGTMTNFLWVSNVHGQTTSFYAMVSLLESTGMALESAGMDRNGTGMD